MRVQFLVAALVLLVSLRAQEQENYPYVDWIRNDHKGQTDSVFAEGKLRPVPKVIWQTYKTEIASLPRDAKRCSGQWIQKNPDYVYEFHSDEKAVKFIEEYYDKFTLNMYKTFPIGVMRADFWRYAVLYQFGGVYLDIDTSPLLSINAWKYYPFDENQVVIGIENDLNFCNWAIISAPKHPLLANVVRTIRDAWEHDKLTETNLPEKHEEFVHMYTGPTVFTKGIVNFFGMNYTDPIFDRNHAKTLLTMYLNQSSPVYKRCREFGIAFEEKAFFQGKNLKHLYGSQKFRDGYVKWVDQRRKWVDKDIDPGDQLIKKEDGGIRVLKSVRHLELDFEAVQTPNMVISSRLRRKWERLNYEKESGNCGFLFCGRKRPLPSAISRNWRCARDSRLKFIIQIGNKYIGATNSSP